MNAPVQINATPTLAELAELLLNAKAREAAANEERLAIEEQLITMVGTKEEGTTTATEGNYKVKTVGKLTRSVDTDAVQTDWDNLPAEVKKCFKWKADIDTKNLRSLESMRDDLVPLLSTYVTTKPAKPSVTIEELSH